jgi:hypothetical protein
LPFGLNYNAKLENLQTTGYNMGMKEVLRNGLTATALVTGAVIGIKSESSLAHAVTFPAQETGNHLYLESAPSHSEFDERVKKSFGTVLVAGEVMLVTALSYKISEGSRGTIEVKFLKQKPRIPTQKPQTRQIKWEEWFLEYGVPAANFVGMTGLTTLWWLDRL